MTSRYDCTQEYGNTAVYTYICIYIYIYIYIYILYLISLHHTIPFSRMPSMNQLQVSTLTLGMVPICCMGYIYRTSIPCQRPPDHTCMYTVCRLIWPTIYRTTRDVCRTACVCARVWACAAWQRQLCTWQTHMRETDITCNVCARARVCVCVCGRARVRACVAA